MGQRFSLIKRECGVRVGDTIGCLPPYTSTLSSYLLVSISISDMGVAARKTSLVFTLVAQSH